MLKTLQVRNYVLIDSLDITFPAGLVIITGQTGAGKSILLGAISLLLGSKADASMVGEAGDNCVVEATFEIDGGPLEEEFAAEDLDWNGGRITVRRVLGRTGRSRSFVNDEPVSVTTLSRISSFLMDIHSQHQTMLVTGAKYQLSLLDHFCGNADALALCRTRYAELLSVRRELRELREAVSADRQQSEYNQARLKQLEDAGIRDGELEELELEQRTLANSEELKSAFLTVDMLLDPSGDDVKGVESALRDCSRLLERMSSFVPSCRELASRLESSRLEIDDVLGEIRTIGQGLEDSSGRLAAVEERMSCLYDLMRRFGCKDESELIARRDALALIVDRTCNADERLAGLERREKAALDAYVSASDDLHRSRTGAAPALASEIQEMVRSLELEKAVFEIDVEDAAESAEGRDSAVFRFSSSGAAPSELSRCASGGELSRIMLCLKAVKARYTEMPSMVFDEIDTGVSGSVADKMGALICAMGGHMQVFAITHLPQVAVKGDAHFLVVKTVEDGGHAKTAISRIDGDDRVMEIARMLSGSTISEAAVANARDLLRNKS